MLFIKHKLEYGEIIKIPLDNNIYNACPVCGKDVLVDFETLVKQKEFDYKNSELWCSKCTKIHLLKQKLHIVNW